MGDSYSGESSSEFKRVHEEITRLFKETVVWGDAGEPPADLQKPNNWKPDIYRKAMRIFAKTPVALATFYRLRKGKKIIPPKKNLSFAENFFHMD